MTTTVVSKITSVIAKPVVVGTPVVVDTRQFPILKSITLIPGATGSLLCESTTSPDLANAMWDSEFSGSKAARYRGSLNLPITGLRFTATTIDGSFEINA